MLLFFGIVCTTEQIFLNLCGKTTWRFTISKNYHKYLRFPLGFVEPRARTILLIVLKVSMLNFQIDFSNTVIFFGKDWKSGLNVPEVCTFLVLVIFDFAFLIVMEAT